MILDLGRKYYKRYRKRTRRKDKSPTYEKPIDDDLDAKFEEGYNNRDQRRRSRYDEKDVEIFEVGSPRNKGQHNSPRSGHKERRRHRERVAEDIVEVRAENGRREFRERDEVQRVGVRQRDDIIEVVEGEGIRARVRPRDETREREESFIEVIEEHSSEEEGRRDNSRLRPPPPREGASRHSSRSRPIAPRAGEIREREEFIEVIEEHDEGDERMGLVSPPPKYRERESRVGGSRIVSPLNSGGTGGTDGRRRRHRERMDRSFLGSPEPARSVGGGRRSRGDYTEMR